MSESLKLFNAVESSEGISLPQKNWHIYKSVKYWLEYIVIPHRL